MQLLRRFWGLIKKSQKTISWTFAFTTIIFTFVPETVFESIKWTIPSHFASTVFNGVIKEDDINVICNRIMLYVVIWLVLTLYYIIRLCVCQSITIKDADFIIKVEYGDILKKNNCKRVISFDECFTTSVGDAPNQIKESSICGQYLNSHEGINVPQLISSAEVKSERRKSKYQNQARYKSGTIVPNGKDLLLAFAPLDESGRGVFPSYKEYLDSLFTLWEELDKYYARHDVCIPILGSGITRIGNGSGTSMSQQKLLDMMIESYRLSPYKIKKPFALRIICKKMDDFSLTNIGEKI